MPKPSRDAPGISLLQNNPPRELLLQKMRSKLASTPSTVQVETLRKREVRRSATATWTVRALVVIGLGAINYLLIGNRDVIAAKLHAPAVPRLPALAESYSPDERALYYTYALYDYPKLKERFGVTGFLAVDQGEARRHLEELLPVVTPKTLGIISGYTPVAFKSAGAGAAR